MSIFRAYDIRGVADKEITSEFIERFSKILVVKLNPKNIVVGYDSRLTSVKYKNAFIRGVTSSGFNIVDIGLVSRPMLNWVAFSQKFELGIMITASHNPKEYNGIKVLYQGRPYAYNEGLKNIEKIMNNTTSPGHSMTRKIGKNLRIPAGVLIGG